MPAAVFSALPPNIAKQGLVEFRLVPMFFTVGINEQAILADKFSDMSAVFDANKQSFDRLESYHRRYQKLMVDFFPAKSQFCFSSTWLSSSSFYFIRLVL